MAGYKGHSVGAVVLLLVAMHYFGNTFHNPDLIDIILYGAIALMFGLWPDVDIKSKGQKIFYSIFFVTDLYLIINQEFEIAAYFGLIIILPILARHRGWTHTLTAMILIPLPILLYPMYDSGLATLAGLPYYAAAVTGYFSHLLLDKEVKVF